MENPTDLQTALRKTCEDAAKEWLLVNDSLELSNSLAEVFERRLTPVFEALRDSVIEECKKVVCDISEMYEKKNRIAASHEWSAFFMCLALDELKGAPR